MVGNRPAAGDTNAQAHFQDHRGHDLGAAEERAVLFGAQLRSDPDGYEEPLSELERLAQTAGAVVTRKISQRRKAYHPTTLVGPGIVDRVGEAAEETAATLLIADNDLSPAQAFNISKRTNKKVVDRSELILDIFASHARSKESQVAVELAQLEYALPRLKRMWTHLERQRGGIGMRGPGETQLETDRRLIKRRIADLKRTLIAIQGRKKREIQARKGEFTVSLVGYTNSGKSTLMRALSGRYTKVADQLFATLDTKTMVVEVKKSRKILLSDTVGFIQKIPHHLIASFHSTLEEVITADLLLHVVDATHPDPKVHVKAVDDVLEDLGAQSVPTIMVLNKIDALVDPVELSLLRRLYPHAVAVSAKTGKGIDDLKAAIAKAMLRFLDERCLTVPVSAGREIAFVHEHGEVLDERYEEEEVHLRFLMTKKNLGALRRLLRRSGSHDEDPGDPASDTPDYFLR